MVFGDIKTCRNKIQFIISNTSLYRLSRTMPLTEYCIRVNFSPVIIGLLPLVPYTNQFLYSQFLSLFSLAISSPFPAKPGNCPPHHRPHFHY